MAEVAVKTCSCCRQAKPLADFGREKAKPDGHQAYCKPCAGARNFEWQKAKAEKKRANNKRYRERYPERLKPDARKNRARVQFKAAVEKGAIVKPKACEACEDEPPSRELHGHHEDYDKPLDVVWLCRPCHADLYKALEAALVKL